MSKHVHAGTTFNVVGTLAAGDTLIGLAGHPGAVIGTGKAPTNDGTIILDGSSKPLATGATLRDTGVLTNAGFISVGGAINSSHAALLDVVHVLDNSGTIDTVAGTDGAGGHVRIDAGGTLDNTGLLTLQNGAASGSDGALLTDDGVLVNAAGGTIDVNAANYVAPGASATLVVAGVLQNGGMLTVGGAGYDTFNRFGAALLTDSGTLINTGTIMVDAVQAQGYNSTLAVSGTLTNQGVVILQDGAAGRQYFSYASPGGLLLDSGVLTNSGTILLLGSEASGGTGGSLAVTGVLTNTGTITVQSAADISVSGTATSSGNITLYGGESYNYKFFYPGRGGVLSVSGAMTNTGTITLNGGISPVYPPNGGYGAELAVAGVMQNEGVLVVGGGVGSAMGYGVFGADYQGTGATIMVQGTLYNNHGTIDLQAATASVYGLYGTGGALIDNAYLNNYRSLISVDGGPGTASGTLTIGAGGTLANGGTISGTGVLVNQGLISNGIFPLTIAGVSFTNDGTVDSFGITSINSVVAADAGRTGLFLVHGLLVFGSAVAASQTVAFYPGPYAKLELGDAKDFGGTLSGLSAGNVIDFLKLDVTSATTAGDILEIGLSSGTTLDLALAAPLVGVSLDLQRDGNHGTDLVLTASPQGHS